MYFLLSGTLVQWQLILYGTLEYPYNYEGALKPPSTTTTKETESVQSSVAKAEDVTETLASTMAIVSRANEIVRVELVHVQ